MRRVLDVFQIRIKTAKVCVTRFLLVYSALIKCWFVDVNPILPKNKRMFILHPWF